MPEVVRKHAVDQILWKWCEVVKVARGPTGFIFDLENRRSQNYTFPILEEKAYFSKKRINIKIYLPRWRGYILLPLSRGLCQDHLI